MRPLRKHDRIEITTDLFQKPEQLKVTKVIGDKVYARSKKLRVMIDRAKEVSYILWSARKDIKLEMIQV